MAAEQKKEKFATKELSVSAVNEVKSDGDGDGTYFIAMSIDSKHLIDGQITEYLQFQTAPNGTHSATTQYIVDFSVFEDAEGGGHCDGKHSANCKALDRITAALDYHHFLVNTPLGDKYGNDPKESFISFCRELYPKRSMLNDYIHFIDHHADPSSIEEIQNRLHFKCESAKNCGASSRHYRDRRHFGGVEVDKLDSDWFIRRIDAVHHMVHHLKEFGLRISSKVELQKVVDSEEDQEDDDKLVDAALKEMSKEIAAKKKEFKTERLDGTTNSKFTLNANVVEGEQGIPRYFMWKVGT